MSLLDTDTFQCEILECESLALATCDWQIAEFRTVEVTRLEVGVWVRSISTHKECEVLAVEVRNGRVSFTLEFPDGRTFDYCWRSTALIDLYCFDRCRKIFCKEHGFSSNDELGQHFCPIHWRQFLEAVE